MITIEFVCTGNEERSPCAQAFAERYLAEQDLAGIIFSSGTHVDVMRNVVHGGDIEDTDLELAIKERIIRKAVRNGVYQEADLEEGKAVLALLEERDAPIERVNGIYRIAKRTFKPIRDRELTRVLGLYNLSLEDYISRQFAPSPEAVIVLGMGDSNTTIVEAAYQKTSHNPTIVSYHTFIGRTDPITPCVMQTDPNAFDVFAQYLHETIPLVLERAQEIER
jgi:protein-tyrosine-phosphatase